MICCIWFLLHVFSKFKNFLRKTIIRGKFLDLSRSNISWNSLIERDVSNANRSLGYIHLNIKNKNQEVRDSAYNTLVRPQLEWDSAYNTLVRPQLEYASALTAKLIFAFVFAYADCWFSHAVAHVVISLTSILYSSSKAFKNLHVGWTASLILSTFRSLVSGEKMLILATDAMKI